MLSRSDQAPAAGASRVSAEDSWAIVDGTKAKNSERLRTSTKEDPTEYLPPGHDKQLQDPVEVCRVPAGQLVQEVAREEFAYLPAAQAVHKVAPRSGEYVPRSHAVQAKSMVDVF